MLVIRLEFLLFEISFTPQAIMGRTSMALSRKGLPELTLSERLTLNAVIAEYCLCPPRRLRRGPRSPTPRAPRTLRCKSPPLTFRSTSRWTGALAKPSQVSDSWAPTSRWPQGLALRRALRRATTRARVSSRTSRGASLGTPRAHPAVFLVGGGLTNRTSPAGTEL